MCSSKKKLTTEVFIKNAKKAHGNKYDYSLVDYKNSKTNVTVICHKKDEFGNEHGAKVLYYTPYEDNATDIYSQLLTPKGRELVHNH